MEMDPKQTPGNRELPQRLTEMGFVGTNDFICWLQSLVLYAAKTYPHRYGRDDLIQEVFTITWQSVICLEFAGDERGMLARFIITTTRQTLANQSRDASVEVRHTESLHQFRQAIIQSVAGEADAIAKEDRDSLNSALAALSPDERELFVVYTLEEWTFADLAKILGRNENSLRVTLSKLRAKLKRVLLSEIPTAIIN